VSSRADRVARLLHQANTKGWRPLSVGLTADARGVELRVDGELFRYRSGGVALQKDVQYFLNLLTLGQAERGHV